MLKLRILNNKEIKEIIKLIEKQWGAELKLKYAFLSNQKNRIFAVNRDISKIDVSKIRVNSIGMYFCEIDGQSIRLGIEGSQIVGQKATKNVAEINEDYSGFVIIKHENDFLGTGKYSNGKILNYIPKARRVSASI